MVETKVRLTVPAEGCCFNYVQAGLVVYGDDDNFIKLDHVSIWNTRQTEFAKEVGRCRPGYPRYGNTVVGAPGEWTWLRIVKTTSTVRTRPTGHLRRPGAYTAYTSLDGVNWTPWRDVDAPLGARCADRTRVHGRHRLRGRVRLRDPDDRSPLIPRGVGTTSSGGDAAFHLRAGRRRS